MPIPTRARTVALAAALAALPALPALADADTDAIAALWQDYAAARVAGDAEAMLALWDSEGIRMPPGRPALTYAQFSAGMAEAFAANPVDAMRITPEEIVVLGDQAWTRGTYTVGDAFVGKFLSILRRQPDGSWRLYRDIFNPSGG